MNKYGFGEIFNNIVTTRNWITSGNDVQYVIKETPSCVFIFFQWTESLQDWKQNFKFWVKPYKNMKTTWYVHKGFLQNWKSVQDEIISKLDIKGRIVMVAGYSHGAALATLCFEDLKYRYPDADIYGVVYGSPRVVWLPKKSIQYRFDAMYNIQVQGDLVTKVPFGIMGYKHVGFRYNIGKKIWLPKVEYHFDYKELLTNED